MDAMLGTRCNENDMTLAIDQGTSLGVTGEPDENGKRVFEWEREWFTALLEANRFITQLSRTKKKFRVETAAIPTLRDPERFVLTGDPRITALYGHWLTLQELVRTPALRERLTPNGYMSAFLEAYTVCQDFTGLVKRLSQGVSETLLPIDYATAVEIVSSLNAAHDTLRQLTSTPAFRKQASNAQRASNKRRRGMVEFVDGLFERHSRLVVVRVDLGYRRKQSDIDFATAKKHRQALLEKRRSDALFEHLIDYCWKLEYGPQKRYHYHMLFFFDGAKVREDMTLAQQIGRYWVKHVTNGKGVYYNCNAGAKKRYKFNAMGMLRHNDAEKMRGLGHTVNYLTKIDDLVTLQVPGKDRTFGRSTLPRAKPSSRGRPRAHTSTPLSSLHQNHM